MGCSICGNDGALASGRKYCKVCQCNYQKKHYASNKDYYKNKATLKKRELYEYIKSFKNYPCVDCGVAYPPYVMDFDHIGDDKSFNLSQMSRLGSKQRIDEEIAKCEVVCANCHRERTQQQKAWLSGNSRKPNL